MKKVAFATLAALVTLTGCNAITAWVKTSQTLVMKFLKLLKKPNKKSKLFFKRHCLSVAMNPPELADFFIPCFYLDKRLHDLIQILSAKQCWLNAFLIIN